MNRLFFSFLNLSKEDLLPSMMAKIVTVVWIGWNFLFLIRFIFLIINLNLNHMLLRNGKYTFIPYFLHTLLFELSTVFLRLPITSLTSHLFFFTLEFKGRFCSGLDSRPHLHSHRLLLLCCGSHHWGSVYGGNYTYVEEGKWKKKGKGCCSCLGVARHSINSVAQTAATTFAFSSVFILFLCEYILPLLFIFVKYFQTF